MSSTYLTALLHDLGDSNGCPFFGQTISAISSPLEPRGDVNMSGADLHARVREDDLPTLPDAQRTRDDPRPGTKMCSHRSNTRYDSPCSLETS